ncbi:hypothetical protein DL89DRAFT_266792, partial [Linderina pennispora]
MSLATWLRNWVPGTSGSVLPGGLTGGTAHWFTSRRHMRILAVIALVTLVVLGVFSLELLSESSSLLERPDQAENDITGYSRRYGVDLAPMIYAWDDPSAISQSQAANNASYSRLPLIERAGKEWTYKTTPGISSFADRPRMVGVEHIKPLLDYAQKHIPKRQIAHTPVYLLATAGMRLLPHSHQSLILDTACFYARENYDFLLPDCKESFQAVSGELEGLFGWVAVNYLMDGFPSQTQSLAQRSHGFLDMGGASAQIAFEPAKMSAQIHKHDLAEVTLRTLDGQDSSYAVFVATFLGHGTNEARRRFVEQLKDAEMLAGSGNGVPMVVLRGKGEFSECVKASEPLLNKTVCPIEPCLFAGVHAPEIDFGTQHTGMHRTDYLGLGGVWDVEKFERRASDFCQKPWSEINSHTVNDDVAVARLQMQCFKAAWLVNVLHNGFGVGDVEVSWTLGALLLKVSQTIPPSYQSIKAKSTPGIRLPDNPGADEEGVELVDDSLWSPLQFVGMRRLYILWSLQPSGTRALLAFTALFTFGLLVGLVYCMFTHRSRKRQWQIILSNEFPLSPIGRSARLNRSVPGTPLSASQIGLAEAAAFMPDAASYGEEPSSKQARMSPSMYVMDGVVSSANDGAVTPTLTTGGIMEPRSRSVVQVAEEVTMSRSSS